MLASYHDFAAKLRSSAATGRFECSQRQVAAPKSSSLH